MDFPQLPPTRMLERLVPPEGRVEMVLDTDTYNEIDDQFCVVYSLLAPEKLDVLAIYAAPFYNKRSDGPGDGMEKSYEEILRLLERLDKSPEGFAFKGSTGCLPSLDEPERSPAALDLVEKAMTERDGPLYVVAIGAITNVASAILIEPKIIERIVVVWLGGMAHEMPTAREFNLKQDPAASKLIFDCGVPLIHIPCQPVTTHLLTVLPEMEKYVKGRGRIGDYLFEIYREYMGEAPARSKVLWDIVTIGWLINPAWVPTDVVHAPVLTDQLTWSRDNSRHFCRVATFVHRDGIFGDLFARLEKRAGENG